MVSSKAILTALCLAGLFVGIAHSAGLAQGAFSLSLDAQVVAHPGQTVALHLVLSSPDSIAGVDVLLGFGPDLLIGSAFEPVSRFQYVSYDDSEPGRFRLILRRHYPDSVFLGPLAPGIDTVGRVRFSVTSEDLLTDIEAPVQFVEDATTPVDDNRLARKDSSFVTAPDLEWSDGSILIRHPLYGDVNDDGYPHTIADAIFFANYLAGTQDLTPRQRANADVNGDGFQAGMADFVELIRVVTDE